MQRLQWWMQNIKGRKPAKHQRQETLRAREFSRSCSDWLHVCRPGRGRSIAAKEDGGRESKKRSLSAESLRAAAAGQS
jgi:hypothetical protein